VPNPIGKFYRYAGIIQDTTDYKLIAGLLNMSSQVFSEALSETAEFLTSTP